MRKRMPRDVNKETAIPTGKVILPKDIKYH